MTSPCSFYHEGCFLLPCVPGEIAPITTLHDRANRIALLLITLSYNETTASHVVNQCAAHGFHKLLFTQLWIESGGVSVDSDVGMGRLKRSLWVIQKHWAVLLHCALRCSSINTRLSCTKTRTASICSSFYLNSAISKDVERALSSHWCCLSLCTSSLPTDIKHHHLHAFLARPQPATINRKLS